MARKRYKPQGTISLLRQAQVLHGKGLWIEGPIRQ